MSIKIRNIVPGFLSARLWGDRKRFGLVPQGDDPCWREWQSMYLDFYEDNQREGIGAIVNDAGYRVMSEVDLDGKTVLEIGPGDIRHIEFWNSRPQKFILADIQEGMLLKGVKKLDDAGVRTEKILLKRGQPLPIPDSSVDIVVSFYSLEHIYPLKPYLQQVKRVLKPGGILVGAIPCEGGLAWGGGRFVTSRRWYKKHTSINPDKIICWEHPNFADQIVSMLDTEFSRQKLRHWPFAWVPLIDFNLVLKFVYRLAP